MNNADAIKALQDYWESTNPTEDDEFMFTEALEYLIRETKDPKYMCELGWHYCSKKRFDLELKYLEMAAEYGYGPAYEELGYMWYYGQHGEQDYKKAFEYFTKGAEIGDDGKPNLWCKYKLADMYRFGCAVEKDEKKYRELIEEAYEEVKHRRMLNDPVPEVFLRYAGICSEDGDNKEAARLLKHGKKFMAERLSLDAFWGHIEVMGRIVKFLYEITPFDKEHMDFYDLFYLTKEPGTYAFKYGNRKYRIKVEDNKERAIGFEGKWYRDFGELCQNAVLDGMKLTAIYDDLYGWEVAA